MRAERPKSRPYALRVIVSIVVVAFSATAAVPTASAELRVVVVPSLERGDLAALEARGAVGLLVPDAGPETSAARSRAALERGEVRNSILGGLPGGKPLVEAETAAAIPSGPAIVLALPQGGLQPNDRRYPIAVLGDDYHGVLTSESTRIPGLVSIVDVAPTALGRVDALGSTADDDPLATLNDLDRRIDANRDAKAPVLLLSLALIVAVAVFLPAAVLPAFAAVLLANLAAGAVGATDVWVEMLAVAVAVAASLALAHAGPRVHGLLLAAVLGAYLVSLAQRCSGGVSGCGRSSASPRSRWSPSAEARSEPTAAAPWCCSRASSSSPASSMGSIGAWPSVRPSSSASSPSRWPSAAPAT